MLDSAVQCNSYFLRSISLLRTFQYNCFNLIILQSISSMNRQTCKWTSVYRKAHRPRIQETQPAVSYRDASREHREDLFRIQGCECTVSLSASMSRGRSMAVKEDGNRANLGGEVILSTEMDDEKAIPSGSWTVRRKEVLVEELARPIPRVAHYALH